FLNHPFQQPCEGFFISVGNAIFYCFYCGILKTDCCIPRFCRFGSGGAHQPFIKAYRKPVSGF
ncbi:hypothetical protein, partial [Neisseria lactamica]|uniref:hypothetical protein n=1 Tax=Neisseria lactamica TaxID=486 RepID=UPI001C3F8734